MGAGQQSRVHCVRLAGQKADLWRLRQHPHVMGLPFKPEIKRAERDNAIDQFLRDDVTPNEKAGWGDLFTSLPRQLTAEEKRAWLDALTGVSCGSDAFFPFRDSIDRAAATGVKYVLEPGRLDPRRQRHQGRRRVRHDDGLQRRAAVPPLVGPVAASGCDRFRGARRRSGRSFPADRAGLLRPFRTVPAEKR